MWEALKRLWCRHKRRKMGPYVSRPITNKKVMQNHPFFRQKPEKWIGAWLDMLKDEGVDWCAKIQTDPKCRTTLAIDLLLYDSDDDPMLYDVTPWHIIQIHGTPIGYLPGKELVRMVWTGDDGEKKVHQVDVSMIYHDLVMADRIAP